MSSIIPVVPLTGSISSNGKLSGTLINVNPPVISGEISDDTITHNTYDGSYEVFPRKVTQVLDTANKFMAHDLTIDAISYSEVSNPEGGETVNIGYE